MVDQHLFLYFRVSIYTSKSFSSFSVSCVSRKSAYPLLSRLCDVLVGLEETADVQRLTAPDVAVDGPVEGKLQGAAVERAGHHIRGTSHARIGVGCCSQDLGFGSHGRRGGAGRRGLPMGLEGRLGHGSA